MGIFGNELGYHVLHAVVFVTIAGLRLGRDIGRRIAEAGPGGGCSQCPFGGYFATIDHGGDTNSLIGVFCAGIALAGSHAARRTALGRDAGECPASAVALDPTRGSAVYAGIYLLLEAAVYYRDPRSPRPALAAGAFAAVAALPVHSETCGTRGTRFQQHGLPARRAAAGGRFRPECVLQRRDPGVAQRWFNDYPEPGNERLAAGAGDTTAVTAGRRHRVFTRARCLLTKGSSRLNTPEAGAIFYRIQHMMPLVADPPSAGLVLNLAGRVGGDRVAAVIGLTSPSVRPVRHVPNSASVQSRSIDPSPRPMASTHAGRDHPHRDMDSDPARRSVTTEPFDVHFEGLLPGLAGQRSTAR